MENRQYFSVMTPPASAGSMSFTLTTYDAESITYDINNLQVISTNNINLVMSVTGLSTTDTEDGAAIKILNQLNIQLTQASAQYTTIPAWVTDGPQNGIRVTRTDHALCFFSEAQFQIVVSDTSGTQFVQSTEPVLVNLAEAKELAFVSGQEFQDQDGDDLTDAQIIVLLKRASSTFIRVTRNPIVLSTYVHEMIGNLTDSIKLCHWPISEIDPLYVRRPVIPQFFLSILADNLIRFSVISNDGWVRFRYAQDQVMTFEPFDIGNDCHLSYIAGRKFIPDAVKDAVLDLSVGLAIDDISELAGGSLRVKTKSKTAILQEVFSGLEDYMH